MLGKIQTSLKFKKPRFIRAVTDPETTLLIKHSIIPEYTLKYLEAPQALDNQKE